MELTLPADLQAKLTRLAEVRGTDPDALAREPIERPVDYDDWFTAKWRRAGRGRQWRHSTP